MTGLSTCGKGTEDRVSARSVSVTVDQGQPQRAPECNPPTCSTPAAAGRSCAVLTRPAPPTPRVARAPLHPARADHDIIRQARRSRHPLTSGGTAATSVELSAPRVALLRRGAHGGTSCRLPCAPAHPPGRGTEGLAVRARVSCSCAPPSRWLQTMRPARGAGATRRTRPSASRPENVPVESGTEPAPTLTPDPTRPWWPVLAAVAGLADGHVGVGPPRAPGRAGTWGGLPASGVDRREPTAAPRGGGGVPQHAASPHATTRLWSRVRALVPAV